MLWATSKYVHAGCQECWLSAEPVCPNANFSHNIKLYRADHAKFLRRDYEWDLGSPLWPGNQTTEYAVKTPHFTSSSHVLQDHLSQQGYGVCILGQRRSSDGWLLRASQDYHRCVLCWVGLQTAWNNQQKVPRKVDGRSAASPRQCTSAHLPRCHGHYPRNANAVIPGEKRERVIDSCSLNEMPCSDRSVFKRLLLVS